MSREARDLFAERDRLTNRLREVDDRLRQLKGAYMRESGIWGIGTERFRQEVHSEEHA